MLGIDSQLNGAHVICEFEDTWMSICRGPECQGLRIQVSKLMFSISQMALHGFLLISYHLLYPDTL